MKITILTFILAVGFSIFSEFSLRSVNLTIAIILLFFIILIGVIFDTIGIAVAAADIEPFNSMAAQRIKAAKHSIYLIHNASMVSNFCNDVIGDIAGIISGAASAIIISKIINLNLSFINIAYVSIGLTALIASLTVGGKAIGKIVAINFSKEIVRFSGYIIYYIDKVFNLELT